MDTIKELATAPAAAPATQMYTRTLAPGLPSTSSLTLPREQQAASSSSKRGLFHWREREREGSQPSASASLTVTLAEMDSPSDTMKGETGTVGGDSASGVVVQFSMADDQQESGQRESFSRQDRAPSPDYPLPPRKLVVLREVRDGVRRFAFLLESCKPGHLPDAPMVGALMELVSVGWKIRFLKLGFYKNAHHTGVRKLFQGDLF